MIISAKDGDEHFKRGFGVHENMLLVKDLIKFNFIDVDLSFGNSFLGKERNFTNSNKVTMTGRYHKII